MTLGMRVNDGALGTGRMTQCCITLHLDVEPAVARAQSQLQSNVLHMPREGLAPDLHLQLTSVQQHAVQGGRGQADAQ
jgi:hypothetical protein